MTLARRILLQIGVAIAVVIVAITAIGYRQTVEGARTEALDNLRTITESRARYEAATFTLAQENTAALRDEFLRRLTALGNTDPREEFDAWFVRYPDGLIRVRPERDDFKHLPSIYIRAQVTLDAQLRREVVAAFRLLREWGPVLTERYYSAYIDLPGQSLIMYSPSVNWGKEADPTTNNFDYPPVQDSAPARNPRRSPLWTDVYFDDKANIWMLSVITPMDQGRWIGTASQDIAVDQLIRRTTNESAPGTYNLLMDSKGKLVAHPEMMEKIRSSAGNLDIQTLGDPELKSIFDESSKMVGTVEVRATPDGKSFLGIARIEGPNWYFVNVYPQSLVAQRGLEAARATLIGGALGLLLELALLAWILRRQVAEPLQALNVAAESVAAGDMRTSLSTIGTGELVNLARSFVRMTDKVRQRDESLQARASELEHEIRQRKLVDESLAVSEAFKDTLLQTIPDAVFVKDLRGAFLIANRSFESIYNLKLEDIRGKTDFELIPYERADFYAKQDADTLLAGKATVSESWQKDSVTGRDALFETIKVPVFGTGGQPIGLMGIARDITARKRAEDALQTLNQTLEHRVRERTRELEQTNSRLTQTLDDLKRMQFELVQGEKLASLGRMVAGLAHELNTPIGNALTIGSTMAEHARDALKKMAGGELRRSTLTDFLENTVQGTEVLERALRQANELITNFKHVSADQLSMRRRTFDLAVAVEEILSTLRPSLRTTPYKLVANVPEGIGMESYPGLLAQVISNLVNNARIHAFEGLDHGTVTVTARDLGMQVEISVSDDGKGIAAEIRNRIFDPFFTTRMGRGGTGLGLSIVFDAVTQGLGGSIRVEQLQSGGSSFVITIARYDSRPLTAAQEV